jgi:hypothetical protein
MHLATSLETSSMSSYGMNPDDDFGQGASIVTSVVGAWISREAPLGLGTLVAPTVAVPSWTRTFWPAAIPLAVAAA